MELTWSIEDVARTSDEVAARRRFDQRNFIWLVFLLIFFGIVSTVEMLSNLSRRTPGDLAVSSANFVFVALLLFFLRDVHRISKGGNGIWAPARWMRDHLTATAITYIAVQFALCVTFARRDGDWVAWTVTFPLFLLGFRMLVAEIALMHALLVTGSLAMMYIAPPLGHGPDEPRKFWIAMLVINSCAAAIEIFTSLRLRRQVVSEFNERRTQAREQIRMRDELRYARELQLSMLPECAPALEWADICGVSIPATEVGGDYYDYFVDRDRVALVCGDVAGHGMASGLVLSALRSGFTLLRDNLGDPAAVLQRLHDLVAQTSRRRMLVTVSVVLLDRGAQRATIASAGHPPIIRKRADGSVEVIELYAPPLGVRLPVSIPQRELAIAPGDVFVLHSDGIYETRNAGGESYGIERLARFIREHATADAESLRDAIVQDVNAYRGAVEQDDDVTVVVARV